MITVCLVLSLLGGWEHEPIGVAEDTAGFKGMIVADARNDGVLRVYGGSNDFRIYEFSYSDGEWIRAVLGIQGRAHGIHVGQARNDGINRLDAATDTGAFMPEIYEYTWNGSDWDQVSINKFTDETYDVPLGFGRNDDTLRIYTGTQGGECFEYTWRDDNWEVEEIGGVSAEPQYNKQQTLWVGKGRNDDTLRVYATCEDGKVWEFTFRDDQWRSSVIGNVGCAWDVKIAEGRNDGVKRVYVSSGIGANTPGEVHEFSWDNGEWTRVDMGQLPEVGNNNIAWGLTAGEGRNDGTIRIYTGSFKGYLYEYTWRNDAWQFIEVADLGNWKHLHDLNIARGRNDDTLRIYASSGDGHIHEFTFRPETGVAVYPDSSAITDPSVAVTYNLWVKNTGKQTDTLDLVAYGTLSGWTAQLTDTTGSPLPDSDSDGKADVGAVESGDSVAFRLVITPPASATAGTMDSTFIRATTSLTPVASDEALLRTMIAQTAALVIEPDQQDTLADGASIDYLLTVRNESNSADLVDLTTSGTLSGWSAELLDDGGNLLPDSDSDGLPDVGPLSAYGGSANIIFRVSPPPGEQKETADTSFVTALSNIDPSVKDSARLVSTVINPSLNVTVEPDTNAATSEGEITYPMRVINSAPEPDSFVLWTESDLGWDAQLQTSTGPMSAQETLLVELTITIPESVASITGSPDEANTERRVLYAQSLTDETVQDSAVIVTLAVPPLDIHNFPNPFSGSTTFIYSIPQDGLATLVIYNRAGEHIITLFEDEPYGPSIHTWPWDGVNLTGESVAPGVYLYTLTFKPDDGGKTRRIVKSALLQP